MNNSYMAGLLSAALASIVWGLAPVFIARFARHLSEYTISVLRSLYAVLVLAPIVLYTRVFTLNAEGLLVIFVSALLGPFAGAISYIKSIKLIGSGNAVTISYLYILVAQFASYLLLREETSYTTYIGSIIALIGVFMVYSGEKHVMNYIGISYGLLAATLWGFASTILKIATKYGDPVYIAFMRNLFTVLILLPLTYRETARVFCDYRIVLTSLVSGALGLGIGMWLFIYAMANIGVSITVLITSITPILTRLFSVYIAGEKPSYRAYLGTVITSLGILLGVYQ